MTELNPFNNSFKAKVLSDPNLNRNDAELLKFTASGQVRVVTEVSPPDYSFTRTRGGSPAPDPVPPALPAFPASDEMWALQGFHGLKGYIIFTLGAAPTANIELWAFDAANENWVLVDTVTAVPSAKEFRFADGVLGRTVYVRLSAINGAPTDYDLFVSPE